MLSFPEEFEVVRLDDTSRPLILHTTRGCLTSFQWYSVNGRVYITHGWTEFCKELGLLAGDTCVFKKIGCHNIRLSVQECSGTIKHPLVCHCTVGLGHNKVIIPSSQVASLLSRYTYVSPWLFMNSRQRDLLATVVMITMPRIPYFVFNYRQSIKDSAELRICRSYARKFLPKQPGWTRVYYGTKNVGMYIWLSVGSDGCASFTTNWQCFAEANSMMVGAAYFIRFSVDYRGTYVAVFEELE
ncbi:hypothetical protein ACP70R_044365 [Stipagrostis hirtigluma subsp. patula]